MCVSSDCANVLNSYKLLFVFCIQIPNKTTADCVQFYYFWKKLRVDYKASYSANDNTDGMQHMHQHVEMRPHVCEMPDCSAVSF